MCERAHCLNGIHISNLPVQMVGYGCLFRFDAQFPGTVFVRETAAAAETPHQLFKGSADASLSCQQPAALKPPGLDAARQTYLYRHIREFVSDEWKDTVCPVPGSVFPLTVTVNPSSPQQPCQDEEERGSSDTEPASPVKGGRGRGRGRGRGSRSKPPAASCSRTTDEVAVNVGRGGRKGRGKTSK